MVPGLRSCDTLLEISNHADSALRVENNPRKKTPMPPSALASKYGLPAMRFMAYLN